MIAYERREIMKHAVIAGGSGFLGKALQRRLAKNGWRLTILTRSPDRIKTKAEIKAVKWLADGARPEEELEQADAFINLAGETINGIRWTSKKKERILRSRLTATKEVCRLIEKMEYKPKVLVNASAVGYYGMSASETFTEQTSSTATDFLAGVVQKWEEQAEQAGRLGVRTVLVRLGLILGKEGALPLMALPYRLGMGGTIGPGSQWVSWIHVEDAARLIEFAIQNPGISGPLNATAPEPVQMDEFGRTLGSVLARPHWLPVPGWALKLLLGEMSSMLIRGQRVIPEKAMQHRFEFLYPTLQHALQDIYVKNR
jgi:hypothetical protein